MDSPTKEAPKGDAWKAILDAFPTSHRLAALILLVVATPLAALAYNNSPYAGWAVISAMIVAFAWYGREIYQEIRNQHCPAKRHHRLLDALRFCEEGMVKETEPGHLSKLLQIDGSEYVREALDELAKCHR